MKTTLTILILITVVLACGNRKPPVISNGPNIVLLVADDLGFSDLGCFGSEIATPNIDGLAEQGKIFSNFYTAATCSPTRAMLLSGVDNHVAGLGDMAERAQYIEAERGQPGYEGYLNSRVVSVAQLLKDAGYHTLMAGKWHLGLTKDQIPHAKGFEKSFSLLQAYANHFYPQPQYSNFLQDDKQVSYPNGNYSTDVYTDKLIDFIDQVRNDSNPFFLYAALTAPHWPLQAPKNYIDKYEGKYTIGYDSLRQLRLKGLRDKGIINQESRAAALPEVKGHLYYPSEEPLRAWNLLSKEEQRIEARKMEIYAAMIDNLDHNIGRLINHLKEIDEFDNTFFVFMSDNGPAPEEANETPDPQNPYPYMGTPNSFVGYGPAWAHASSAINKLYKGYSTDGGIHSPMIIKMPGQQNDGKISTAFTTVMDLAPTFLELAETKYPAAYNGKQLAPLQGESILPYLDNRQTYVHSDNYVVGWELFGRCAVRRGKWKITRVEAPFGTGKFQLYNLEQDPGETTNLALEFPAIYSEMIVLWKKYKKENGVILEEE